MVWTWPAFAQPRSLMPYRRSTQAAPSVYLSLGGLALSAVAGYVNAVALAFFHVPISHMSGAVTHLGTDMIHGRTSAAVFLAGVLSSFLFGAMVSGLLIGAARLEPSRRYGVALILEGLALCFVALCFPRWPQAGLTAAAFACGLQNGMASSYYGLIVRTTHVTGILTDIGVLLGALEALDSGQHPGRFSGWRYGWQPCRRLPECYGFFFTGGRLPVSRSRLYDPILARSQRAATLKLVATFITDRTLHHERNKHCRRL